MVIILTLCQTYQHSSLNYSYQLAVVLWIHALLKAKLFDIIHMNKCANAIT